MQPQLSYACDNVLEIPVICSVTACYANLHGKRRVNELAFVTETFCV